MRHAALSGSPRGVSVGLSIAVAVSLQLVGDLLAQLLIIGMLGAGRETDAYIAALAVPAVVGSIVTAALQSVWLQRFVAYSGDESGWRREQGTAQGQALLLAGGVLLVLWLSEAAWLPLLFPGLDAAQREQVQEYSPALLLAAVFGVQSGLHTAALRARGRFAAAEWLAAAGVPLSLAALWFALPTWGLQSAAWILLARSVLAWLLLQQACGQPLVALVRAWRCTETWRLMRPLLFGSSVYKTSPVVDRYWASQAAAGGITLLALAQALMGAMAAILERVFFVPAMPRLAQLARDRCFPELRRACFGLLAKAGVLLATLLAVMALGEAPLTWLIGSMFSMDAGGAQQVWSIAMLLLGHVYAGIIGPALVSVFYAMGDTRTPVYIGLGGFLFGLVLKWALFARMGVAGLALASSIYFLLNVVLFIRGLEKKMKC